MGKEYLKHYGIKRRSGRYPWGSGEDPYQHESWYSQLLDDISARIKKGDKEKDIARAYDISMRDLRNQKTLAIYYKKLATRDAAQALYDQGIGFTEIARRLGMKNESSVRTLLKDGIRKNEAALAATIDLLENKMKEIKYIDVGAGVASAIGVSDGRFEAALQDMHNKGYEIAEIYIEQANKPGQGTTVRLLCPHGTKVRDIYKELDKIGMINERFVDPSSTELYGLKPVKSIDSKRVAVRYAEDGGADRDGTIELRRGVEGLDLGSATYAQVRIGVDGKYYLKGMAYYVDDLPDGVDIRFNTNKSKKVPKLETFKEMDLDNPDNPFGAQIKPGGQRGYLNIVNEEGDWGNWSKSLASQMLSKQSPGLARNQLDEAYHISRKEFDDIMSYTQPVVRQYLLQQFADKCDTAAVDLKAAAMPGQASYAILPVPDLKENEVYAPRYPNGSRLIMIRYPHGGTFEIPEVTVNNRSAAARKIMGNAPIDAIGIHPKVAQQLSGADFDGDTVTAFVDNNRVVKTRPMLKELEGWDPKTAYPATEHTRRVDKEGHTITDAMKQREMGVVSNLICDMTLKGCHSDEEYARAVKYSMVVIDSYKHNLDYKAAEAALNIKELKKKYQTHEDDPTKYGGASTLISKASSAQRVSERRLNYRPDPETGELDWHETGRMRRDKQGNLVPRLSKIQAMRLTKDANTLSSGSRMETVYAEYANNMKALANESRKEAMRITTIAPSQKAKEKYSKELAELDEMLRKAKSHAPVERAAQIIAKSVLDDKRQKAGRKLTQKEQSKIRAQALSKARADLGGARPKVKITPEQWEAIQNGAVSKEKLTQLLRFAPPEDIKEYALPKKRRALTANEIAIIQSRVRAGYTQAEIAEALGISSSTVSEYAQTAGKIED